jgi:hypothetical protein
MKTSDGSFYYCFNGQAIVDEKSQVVLAASVAIASNEGFFGWTKTFTDPRFCAAIVDRLTFGGNILETGTDSCRLAHTERRPPPRSPD